MSITKELTIYLRMIKSVTNKFRSHDKKAQSHSCWSDIQAVLFGIEQTVFPYLEHSIQSVSPLNAKYIEAKANLCPILRYSDRFG